MSTKIRPEVSKKRQYYISKHRYYELKHFCLQYNEWKQKLYSLSIVKAPMKITINRNSVEWADPTAENCYEREEAKRKIELVEESADETDPYLGQYILKAVTEGCSYAYLKFVMDIPCGKDLFYKNYHRFFWVLDKKSHILQRL